MDQAAASQWAASAANICPAGGSAGALFAQLLATLIQAQCLLADRSAYPPDTVNPLPEYDFIVVGAGSAGSAVAARLSENPAWKVLVVEAGGDPPPTSDIPMLFPTLQKTETDWSYLTEPDERSCLALAGGRCAWPRGKTLGGSSTINAMIYIRGSPQDYDSWAAAGNEGWSYQDVLPFFKKLEAFDEEELKKRPHTASVHGLNGAIQVSKPARLDPALDAIDSAAKELGYNIIEDYSAEPNIGFGQIHHSMKNGLRSSTARGYLTPAKERKNLHVVKFGYATKVLIDQESRTAYGIQYLKDGKVHEVKATKEVILSAGAINTPHILMHSGIGPKEHLDEIGIPTIKDLRVGYNLQDHVIYTGLLNSRKKRIGKTLEENVFEYLINRTGYLSNTGCSTYTGFVRTDQAPKDLPGLREVDAPTYPDIQMHHIMVDSSRASLFANIYYAEYEDEAKSALKKLTKNEDALLMLPTLLAPTSSGRIKLKSSDPNDLPLIESGYFSDQRDLENLLAGIEVAYRLGTTEAMRAAGFTVKDLPLKACADHAPLTPDYWRCALPHLVTTLYHPAGTAKMGPASDSEAVVDPRLRVYGVRRLRVADASIMPVIVRCNTNVPAIMIGEKCAHMIAEDWQRVEGATRKVEL